MNYLIAGHDEIVKIENEFNMTVENALTEYQRRHNLPHDAKMRAEYYAKFCPDNLSADEKNMVEG